MKIGLICLLYLSFVLPGFAAGAKDTVLFSGEKRRNNLVSELLEVSLAGNSSRAIAFTRPSEGWIFISAKIRGKGTVAFVVDKSSPTTATISRNANGGERAEAMRFVAKGQHQIQVACEGGARVSNFVVKAIPELMDCGLGFDPAIKAFGHYDMSFLKKDILPNVTTLIVPSNIALPQSVIDDWHRQGKTFVAEVGLDRQGQTADDHFKFWTSFFDRNAFLDGILINEFGMNRPSGRPLTARRKREQTWHQVYEDTFRKIRADARYKDKMVYVYFGGSGNVVNYEDTGTTFVRTLSDCRYPIALERYIFERSSEKFSKDALDAFVAGMADWKEKEPAAKEQMIIAFGLFSMPPGGINKLPNVDYHVWMDQQMNIVANHPTLAGIRGLEWWTSTLADEETVRFVGKLYRHYAIEGKTEMFLKDPLFLPHLQNTDFEKGTEGWTLHAAEEGSIQPKSFPRYGRIEGRYMGLGRPPDPEHLGDKFLWIKRSEKGPNTFSQRVKSLTPGRLYSLEMFACDYNDLVHPQKKTQEEANKFIGTVKMTGVDVDSKRSFTEMYPSGPEPKIPVWITYHWIVFKPQSTTATLTVSDWPEGTAPNAPFGQEQTFNFLELQPYHE